MTRGGHLTWLSLLVLSLYVGLRASPVLAASTAGPVAVAQGRLASPVGGLAEGYFHVWRQGNTVTATVGAVRSRGGAIPFSLFAVPEGFRPAGTVTWHITDVQAVDARGYLLAAPIPAHFTVEVTPQGTVQWTEDNPDPVEGYWRYKGQVQWTTPEPMLLMAGHFEWSGGWPRYEKWEGNKFRLERLGSTVRATIRARSSGVSGEGLFTVPPGLRPLAPVTGELRGDLPVPYTLQISPAGTSTYLPLNPQAENRHITYSTTMTWTTQDPAQMEFQGSFPPQPSAGRGQFKLLRRGQTVLAQLSAGATAVPPWFPPSASPPQLSMDPDDWANQHPGRDYEPELRVVDSDDQLIHRATYLADPDLRYDILGQNLDPPAWQIRLGDDRVIWVKDYGFLIHGDSRTVPVTNPLFQIPQGFRPGRTKTWILNSQPVDSEGHVPENPTWQPLSVEITPEGRAFYDHVPVGEAGFRQFQTTLAWPVGADVCQRSQGLKEALAATFQTFRCENVTWADLARVRNLEVNANTNIVSSREYLTKDLESFLPFDLMGLTGLRSLAVTHELSSLGDYVYTHWPVPVPPLFWAQVPHLEHLTFRNVALNQVPDDFLGHTPALQSLDLTLAQVTRLPPGFLAFTPQLQSLTLDLGQDLTELPPGFLAHPPRLQHLSLNGPDAVLARLLPHLFTAAADLETLQLRVSGAGTIHLPPEIGQLHNLTHLVLTRNQLTALPPELGQLQNLEHLDLESNQLTALPPELGQLHNLTHLVLTRNQLTALPPELGQLHNLVELHLNHNQLTALPPQMGQLQTLTDLHLGYNPLTALPPEIGQLHNLVELYLHGNQLTALPPEIGQLQSLTQLYLHGNQLTALMALPPELFQLQNLITLYLSGNPWLDCLPKEWRDTGILFRANDDPFLPFCPA